MRWEGIGWANGCLCAGCEQFGEQCGGYGVVALSGLFAVSWFVLTREIDRSMKSDERAWEEIETE